MVQNRNKLYLNYMNIQTNKKLQQRQLDDQDSPNSNDAAS